MNAIYETVKFVKVETKHHNIALNANTLKIIDTEAASFTPASLNCNHHIPSDCEGFISDSLSSHSITAKSIYCSSVNLATAPMKTKPT